MTPFLLKAESLNYKESVVTLRRLLVQGIAGGVFT